MSQSFTNPPIFNRNFGAVNAVSKTYNGLRVMEKDNLGGKNTYTISGSLFDLTTTGTGRAVPFLARQRFFKLFDLWNNILNSGMFKEYTTLSGVSLFGSPYLGGAYINCITEYLFRPSVNTAYNNALNVLNFNPYSILRQFTLFTKACFDGIENSKFNVTSTGPFKLQIYTTGFKPFEQYINDKYHPREPFLVNQLNSFITFMLNYLNKDYVDTLPILNMSLNEYVLLLDKEDKTEDDLNQINLFKTNFNALLNKIITNFVSKVSQTNVEINKERAQVKVSPETVSLGLNILSDDWFFVSSPISPIQLPTASMSTVIKKIKIGKKDDGGGSPEIPEITEEYQETIINPDYISEEETPGIPQTIEVTRTRIIQEYVPATPPIIGENIYTYEPCTRISTDTPIQYDLQTVNWFNSDDRPFLFFYCGAQPIGIDVNKFILSDKNLTNPLNLYRNQVLIGGCFLSIGLNDFGIDNPLNDTSEIKESNRFKCLERLQDNKYDVILNNKIDSNTSKEVKDFSVFKLSFIDSLNLFIKLF